MKLLLPLFSLCGLLASTPAFAQTVTKLDRLFGTSFRQIAIHLMTGRGSRKRELEADRFAVTIVGDPEIVISALTKLHLHNQAPVKLDRLDEIASSHPSLVRRVAAIRSEFGSDSGTSAKRETVVL